MKVRGPLNRVIYFIMKIFFFKFSFWLKTKSPLSFAETINKLQTQVILYFDYDVSLSRVADCGPGCWSEQTDLLVPRWFILSSPSLRRNVILWAARRRTRRVNFAFSPSQLPLSFQAYIHFHLKLTIHSATDGKQLTRNWFISNEFNFAKCKNGEYLRIWRKLL